MISRAAGGGRPDGPHRNASFAEAVAIAALFISGWTLILAWGLRKPFERKGLLLITAILLMASILLELTFYRSMLGGSGFALGVGLRVALVVKFTWSYLYARESVADA